MSYHDFGDTLRHLRKMRNLTQDEFGARVGLSKAVVSKYENGIGYPTLETLEKISRCFGVSADHLLGISESRKLDASALTERQADLVAQLIHELSSDSHSGRPN